MPPMETDMTTDAAARAPAIPGLVVRPFAGEADLPEIARVRDAEWEADGLPERTSVDDLRTQWGHASEQFDASRDVSVVELEGRVVGVTHLDWIDATDGVREYRGRCWIDPAHRRRGIGSVLIARTEAVRRARAAAAPTDRPTVLAMWTAQTNAGAIALAERSGYTPVRWFADMDRSLVDEPLPDVPPLPEGIEVRPVTREHAQQIWDADGEAFRDHWGGWDGSAAGFRRWVESSEFQPTRMVVAWDGDEVAGAVLNAIYPHDNAALGVDRGWLDSVFTRRRWRRRGLARALIVRSLHLLRDEGMTVATLGVDADNPSGAWGLYESAGFRPTARFTAWRKPMEADR
jgi:mycothiol synthase